MASNFQLPKPVRAAYDVSKYSPITGGFVNPNSLTNSPAVTVGGNPAVPKPVGGNAAGLPLKNKDDAWKVYAELLKGYLGGAQQEANNLPALSQNRAYQAQRSYNSLSPGAVQASIAAQQAKLQGEARRNARQGQLALGPAAQGMAGGLALDAQNRATSQGNALSAQEYSPEMMAQREMMRNQFLDPSYYTTSLGMAQNALTGLGNQFGGAGQQQQKPSFLDSILGIGGMLGGFF